MPRVSLGKYVVIRSGCKIQNDVIIDDGTFVNENTQIDQKVVVGKYCSISHGVKIAMANHPLHYFTTSPLFYAKSRGLINKDIFDDFKHKPKTIIEHDVLIGANCIVLAGVRLGTGSVIGSGSIVTRDVPPYSIVAGNPATLIRYRFDNDIIQEIMKTQWWDRDIEYLQEIVSNEERGEFCIQNFLNKLNSKSEK